MPGCNSFVFNKLMLFKKIQKQKKCGPLRKKVKSFNCPLMKISKWLSSSFVRLFY